MPLQLGHVHNVFHVYILKKYTYDPSHVIPYVDILLQAGITDKEKSIEILSREIPLYHNKETPMVKVHWEKHTEEESTWESESEMHEKCWLFRSQS